MYAGLLSEFPEGSRKILDTSKGAVIVTNQQGVLYAVNAKCPHLGLPMKTGTITTSNNAGESPILTCKFHNSQFRLEDGQCVNWCTGVMGIPGTEMVIHHTLPTRPIHVFYRFILFIFYQYFTHPINNRYQYTLHLLDLVYSTLPFPTLLTQPHSTPLRLPYIDRWRGLWVSLAGRRDLLLLFIP